VKMLMYQILGGRLMLNFQKQVEEFKKNGYLLVKNVFSAEEIKELKREIYKCASKDLNHEGVAAAAGIIKHPINIKELPIGVAQGLHKFEGDAPIGVAQGLHKFEGDAPIGVAQGLHKFGGDTPIGVAQGLHKFEGDAPIGVAQGLHKFGGDTPIGVAQGLHKFEGDAPIGVAQGLHKFGGDTPIGVAQGLHKFEGDAPIGVAQGLHKFGGDTPIGVAQGLHKFEGDAPIGVAQGLHKFGGDTPIGVAQGLHKFEGDAPIGVAQGLHKFEGDAPIGVAQGLYKFQEDMTLAVAQDKNEMERKNEGLNELWKVNSNIRKFSLNAKLLEYVQACMGVQDISLLSDTLLNKPANNGAASPLHRDAPFWKGLYPQNQINCWIPLQDTHINNGCLGYIPGSHLDTENLSEKPDVLMEHDLTLTSDQKEKIKFIEVEAGDILIHHSLTLHGTGPNLTDSPRLAYVLHYMPTDSYVEGDEMFKDISDCPQLIRNGQPVKEY
jgi:ectoine hydroxylase-related dioxygenase (phytanoyl-CoA dioxygenase family)